MVISVLIATESTITDKERALICSLPGYDPFYGADDYYYDTDEADKAAAFFPLFLTHVRGNKEERNKPFDLAPWQEATVRNLFGWKHNITNLRRYTEAFIYVPRKNGKTTFAGGILVYVFGCDDEPGAEVYSAAADRKQAKLIFDIVTGMILNDKHLKDRFTCQKYTIIRNDDPLSTYSPLSHDAHTKHGLNPSLVIVDEVHAQKDSELIDVLSTGMGSRDEPLTINISTADYDKPSPCNAMLERAKRILDKEIEDVNFLPVLFYADKEDDWKSEATWRKANPNYGVSLKVAHMKRECQRAIDSPAEENKFKRLHLNMQTEQSERWISIDHWDSCLSLFDKEKLKGQECYAGLDMASTGDITSFVLFFPEYMACLSWHWLPKENFHKRKMNARFYDKGELTLTPGTTTDYKIVKKEISEHAKEYGLIDIGFDPWSCLQLAQDLNEDHGLEMVQFRQGAKSMNEPTKRLEKMILDHELTHFDSKILRWMLGNVVITYGENNTIRIDRKKAKEKVDGIVALTMAIGRWMASDGPKTSVYEERGIFEL